VAKQRTAVHERDGSISSLWNEKGDRSEGNDAEHQAAVAEAIAPPSSEDEEFAERPKPDPAAEEFERRGREKAHAQFRAVKDEAQAVYGVVLGQIGVRTPEEWAELLEKAGDEIGNGRFIVRCLGAERYLEPATVAVLLTLRQNLIGHLAHATAADIMMIDAAIIGYYNMLRTQRWLGNRRSGAGSLI
jgi:hypothetical protein